MSSSIRPSALAAVIAALCLGCGQDDGIQRYDVSGTVTLDGQPVTAGQVLFQPDPGAGNSGAPGFAPIREGKYDTKADGKGTIGGAHIVRIEGRNPSAEGTEVQISWETTANLPTEATTQNFDVPADAAQVVETSEPP